MRTIYLDDAPRLLTRKQIAEILHITPRTVTTWIGEGRLKSIKLTSGYGSGRRLVSQKELERFLAEAEKCEKLS